MARVAVIRTDPSTVIEDYAKVMQMAGYQDFLPAGKQTFLNPAISWQEWFPAASTEPWQLEGTARALLDDGFEASTVSVLADESMGGRLGDAFRLNGLEAAAERVGIGFTSLGGHDLTCVPFSPSEGMTVLGSLAGDCELPVPEIFLGNNILHLPTMKTHARTRIAGSAMSSFDAILGKEWTQGDIHALLADLLALQKDLFGGVFTVTDGTLCGDGPGPRTIVPYEKDYLLAGADPVAVDAVMAKMMGFEPLEIEYIRLATERGIGEGDPSRIKVEGEDISGIDFHFTGGNAALVSGNRTYLDYFWYPFRGWKHVGRMAETGWGQLLQEYLPEGAELDRQGKGKAPVLAMAAAAALLGVSASRRVARLGRRGA